MEEIDQFALTYNGYQHFGDDWGARLRRIRDTYDRNSALPQDLGDLRACLFLEQRREHFVWFGSDFRAKEAATKYARIPKPRIVVSKPNSSAASLRLFARASKADASHIQAAPSMFGVGAEHFSDAQTLSRPYRLLTACAQM